MKRIFIGLLLAGTLLGCTKDMTDSDRFGGSDYQGNDVDLRIKDFIWKGLNSWYLWQGDVDDLDDHRFGKTPSVTGNAQYKAFLDRHSDKEAFFYGLLNNYPTTDRFSFITDNYSELEDTFKGISMSAGMDFALVVIPNNDRVFGLVRYVVPNSGAADANIKRGTVFTRVNGTVLTKSNYTRLLQNNNTSMTLGLAKIEGTRGKYSLVETEETVTLTRSRFVENPILIHKVIEQGGKKIGYLMYNAFVSDFDVQLNNVFGEFKSQGIDELVLDLRYNGGGSVSSAIYLSSMITGQFNGQVFSKEQWNKKLQPIVEQQGSSINYFTNEIKGEGSRKIATINSLNLERVYILTTKSTASASELVINSLKAYINVVQIGTITTGKDKASITIYDYTDANNKVKNPAHKWAMQPLVLKMVNAKDEGNYTNGLTPTIPLEEDVKNMGTLGDTNEPLLARALQSITGTTRRTTRSVAEPALPLQEISHSKAGLLGYNEMYK